MADEQVFRLSKKAWRLLGIAVVVGLILLSLLVEVCDSEKTQICDTQSGKCEFSSSCRPLLFDIF
jgi:hypothetical protein